MKDEFSANKNENFNYIYFLKLKTDLDNSYIIMSDALSKVNIKLISIEPTELKRIDKDKKKHIIVVRGDLGSHFAFQNCYKEYFEPAMLQGKCVVYDISSFSELEFNKHYESKLGAKLAYRFFQLPLNLKQIAMTIAVGYFKNRNHSDAWPGGRRAKLPTMTN